ncbi:MAG: hypothetical protein V1766_04160 [Pseudomonadota bacterium]
MKIHHPRHLFFVLLLIGLLAGGQAAASQNSDGAAKTVAANIEKAILQASEWHEQGKIQKGRPLVIPVASDLRLTFSAENFDADLNKAFQILDQLMKRAKAGHDRGSMARPAPVSAPPAQTTVSPSSTAAVPGAAPATDRLSALMQAEKQTAQATPVGQMANMNLEYSVYKDYRQSHQARIQKEDKMVESEKQAVITERQAAAQNQQRKRERNQQLQSQAGAWQAELDKQAKASAAAALQWQQEHGFGAYVKRFLGMVVQTSVGAFTGGFLGTVSTNLANKAVSNLFPAASTDIFSQAAAAGTSAAITQTGTTVGQSVGQQAASTVTGQSGGATQTTATSGIGQYTPPKY